MYLVHCCYFIQARKGFDEKQTPAAVPTESSTNSADGSKSSPSQRSHIKSEDIISPSPKKKNPSPAKASSRLAMMKKKDEEKAMQPKSKNHIPPTKISPKKEPLASPMKFTPKTGSSPTAVKTSPKKPKV